VHSFLAPYVGCAMAEYFWQHLDEDALIVYDDLTAHAHAYREMALLTGSSPGRDSYPGDMFYVHSSLLERAGKLNRNHKTLTSLPMVFAASGDITAYLPTNIMSITDGQWILDMKIFRDTMRPAVNAGLSVSRVGGRGQTHRQQNQAGALFKALTAHHTAQEFARFGSELSVTAQTDLARGELLYKVLNQAPGENYNFKEQTLMLDICLNFTIDEQVNVEGLKKNVRELAPQLQDDDKNFDAIRDELKNRSLITVKKAATKPGTESAPAGGTPANGTPTGEDATKKGDNKKDEKQGDKAPEVIKPESTEEAKK